ncbi:MAG: sigma-54-dependent Fis family transcriptional regulator [Bdellovibrionales bacterium]|nr:sigma-54-dependent Fis family transcriptional regulator [Bdellovibrionales bacterium]
MTNKDVYFDQTILTVDPLFRNMLIMAKNVASSKASVLITGESGTGKDLLVKYIHSNSPRATKKIVTVGCDSVSPLDLETEIFGHENKLTGEKRIGKLELAQGSTLQIDEISALPLALQARLLRVFQESESLGSGFNIRILATSTRDLKDLVRKGEFREDLYYRLNVIPIQIPPLRERPGDLEVLSRHFLDLISAGNGREKKVFSAQAFAKLKQWTWPGNVRELQNVISHAVLTSVNPVIQDADVHIPEIEERKSGSGLSPGMTVSEAEKLLILKTLEFTDQNRTHAARMLGISIRTLRNKINEYKLEGVL